MNNKFGHGELKMCHCSSYHIFLSLANEMHMMGNLVIFLWIFLCNSQSRCCFSYLRKCLHVTLQSVVPLPHLHIYFCSAHLTFLCICFNFIWKRDGKTNGKRSSSLGFLPRFLHYPGQGQAEARSPKLHAGLPCGGQEPKVFTWLFAASQDGE